MKVFEAFRRLLPPVAWIVRAALVVLALSLGGVVHSASDALVAAGVLDGEHEQCPANGACDDCLAGCPNCHCASTLRTIAPDAAVSLETSGDEPSLEHRATETSNVPLGPTLPSLYRPPRTLARSAFIS